MIKPMPLPTRSENDLSPKIAPDERIIRPENNLRPEDAQLFSSYDPVRKSNSRIRQFFNRNQCKVQVFMTWIAPADSFGERELFGLDSLFETNPESCLVILSPSLDSDQGLKILSPLVDRGFRVRAISPDLYDLVMNTPAESWFHLWNKHSRKLEIEEGRILGRLISHHCVICSYRPVKFPQAVNMLKSAP